MNEVAKNNEVVEEKYYEQKFAVDIVERDEDYLLIGEVPGVSKDNLDMHIEDEVLSIKGISSQTRGNRKIQFVRHFKVGNDVDVNKITAKLEDGLLKAILTKPESAKPIQIKIA